MTSPVHLARNIDATREEAISDHENMAATYSDSSISTDAQRKVLDGFVVVTGRSLSRTLDHAEWQQDLAQSRFGVVEMKLPARMASTFGSVVCGISARGRAL